MNQNQTLINNKFKELNIDLTKDEIERAEYYLVRHGKAKGVRESDNGKWHYFLDENNNIDEEVLTIYQSGNVRTHGRDYSSLKSHLLQCQNIHHIYVKEKPYSIDKSNKIARYIRKLNDLMENESFLKSLRYLNPNIDTKDSFRFVESIHSIVSKIFDLDDTNFTDSVAAINDRNFIRYFFASESLISNTKLFWIVFRTIWEKSNFNEINTTQWSDVFSRYNRLENLVFDNVHHARGKVYAQANKDILRNYNLEDYITVYRGFFSSISCIC